MAFVIFLLAYLLRRRLDNLAHQDHDGLWRRLFRSGRTTTPGEESRVWPGLLLVGLPALLLVLGDHLLTAAHWRILGYPIEFVLLVVLMGVPGWRQHLEAYTMAWGRGDMQGAWHHIRDSLPERHRADAVTPEAMHLLLSRQFLAAVFERYFLVAFWYVVGGIGFALMARGIIALRDHWPQVAARERFERWSELVSWLPSRVLSCTFGLAGDLSGWLRSGRSTLLSVISTEQTLIVGANSALTGYALDPARFAELHPDECSRFADRSVIAVRDLLNRSMLIWICAIALLVIAGIL